MKKLRRTKFILLLLAAVFLTTLSGCGEAGDLAQSQISSDSKLETHPSDTEPDTPPSEEALSSSKDGDRRHANSSQIGRTGAV